MLIALIVFDTPMPIEGIFVFCILDMPQGAQRNGHTFAIPEAEEHDESKFCYFNFSTR